VGPHFSTFSIREERFCQSLSNSALRLLAVGQESSGKPIGAGFGLAQAPFTTIGILKLSHGNHQKTASSFG
jgi:hypothetical protein